MYWISDKIALVKKLRDCLNDIIFYNKYHNQIHFILK